MRLYEHQPSGTISRTRQLRHDAPEPERRLLRGLREALPQMKWRHQAPLGPFHADILCFSERLVIEVDGYTHAATSDADTARTAFMARAGDHTFRVANADVMQNCEGVIASLSFSLQEKEGAPKARKDEGDHAKEKGAAA